MGAECINCIYYSTKDKLEVSPSSLFLLNGKRSKKQCSLPVGYEVEPRNRSSATFSS